MFFRISAQITAEWWYYCRNWMDFCISANSRNLQIILTDFGWKFF